MSNASLGWSLLPSSVIIVPCPTGDLGISTRPGSAAPLPVSTASTGLLCLSVGACVHHGRSDTEVELMATTTCIPYLVHDIYIYWQFHNSRQAST